MAATIAARIRTMPPPAIQGGGGGWFVGLNPHRVTADSNGWGRGMLNEWCDPGCQAGLDAARRTMRGDTCSPSPSRIGPSTQPVRIGCSGVPATGRHLRHQPVTLVRLPVAGGSVGWTGDAGSVSPPPPGGSGILSCPRHAGYLDPRDARLVSLTGGFGASMSRASMRLAGFVRLACVVPPSPSPLHSCPGGPGTVSRSDHLAREGGGRFR